MSKLRIGNLSDEDREETQLEEHRDCARDDEFDGGANNVYLTDDTPNESIEEPDVMDDLVSFRGSTSPEGPAQGSGLPHGRQQLRAGQGQNIPSCRSDKVVSPGNDGSSSAARPGPSYMISALPAPWLVSFAGMP